MDTNQEILLARLNELQESCQNQIQFAEAKNGTLLASILALLVYWVGTTSTTSFPNSYAGWAIMFVESICIIFFAYILLCIVSTFVPDTGNIPLDDEGGNCDLPTLSPRDVFKRITGKQQVTKKTCKCLPIKDRNITFFGHLRCFKSGKALCVRLSSQLLGNTKFSDNHYAKALATQVIKCAQIANNKHHCFLISLRLFIPTILLFFFLNTIAQFFCL